MVGDLRELSRSRLLFNFLFVCTHDVYEEKETESSPVSAPLEPLVPHTRTRPGDVDAGATRMQRLSRRRLATAQEKVWESSGKRRKVSTDPTREILLIQTLKSRLHEPQFLFTGTMPMRPSPLPNWETSTGEDP